MMRAIKSGISAIVILCSFFQITFSQEDAPQRPRIWGVAKMTFYINSFSDARDLYGTFLGYEEALRYSSKEGEVLSFKVNDRQFLEFVETDDPGKKGTLISVSFDCEQPEQMEEYLLSRSVPIVKPFGTDGAGNACVSIRSSEYYLVEFIHFLPGGKHKQTAGDHMPDSRISDRLHHAGLYVSDIEKADALFKDVLGFSEMWRLKEDNESMPNYIYLLPRGCIENIEYLYCEDPRACHPCFRVDDMQEMLYTMKERARGEPLSRPIIGSGNRWLYNMKNKDGARVEFTESFTVR